MQVSIILNHTFLHKLNYLNPEENISSNQYGKMVLWELPISQYSNANQVLRKSLKDLMIHTGLLKILLMAGNLI